LTFEILTPFTVRIGGQERPLRVGDVVTLPELQSLKLLAKAQAKVRQVDGGPCYACRSTRRWLSVYGAVICGECHPPASLGLVERWIEIEKESYR
jgi:hypothetical protein